MKTRNFLKSLFLVALMLFSVTNIFAAYANAGPNDTVCVSEYVLAYSSPPCAPAYLWETTGDGTFSDTTIIHPVYTPGINDILNGEVDLILTVWDTVMNSATDTMTLCFLSTITTELDSITTTSFDTLSIPVIVDDANDIEAIDLKFSYNTSVLNYIGYENLASQLSSGYFAVNSIGGNILLSWFGISPISFSDTLVDLKFVVAGYGKSDLIWDLNTCSYQKLCENYINGCVEIEGYTNITGSVTYNNSANTPLTYCDAVLKNSAGNTIKRDQTDINGEYGILYVAPGEYTLDAEYIFVYGGISGWNSADALLAMKEFVGLITLNGVNKSAADVNYNGVINSADALMIQKRFVGLINSFPAGIWTNNFKKSVLNGMQPTLFQTTAYIDTTINIDVLLVGDIDGSFVPYYPWLKKHPTISLYEDGSLNIEDEFVLPLNIEGGVNSISLILDCENIEVLDVSLENENVIFLGSDKLRISWYNINSVIDPVLELKCKVKDINKDVSVAIDPESEITDDIGVKDVMIKMPMLICNNSEYSVYPTVVNDIVNIEYNLDKTSNVEVSLYDMYGRFISNKTDVTDTFKEVFDVSGIKSGNYVLMISVDGMLKGKEIITKY